MSRTFEPPAGRQVFSRNFTPSANDIDANGHVNNVVYLGWAQDMAIAHWDSAASPQEAEALAWVALRHEVDYRRALLPGETALGRTWVSDKAEGPRFDRFVRIDGPDGAMCAQVRTVWCLIERASGRPRRVPPELVARFG
ncbi:MAG: thioesterase family protein [Phenylobacterium sp.]|uniref:acyl-CoA thioesterase n=1 Tax=Phenylobacterium sp. TaxID=1871053 RepID=UPI002721A847|nr:thioesterase family protein [Phenylobacterium sp.]MDO8900582.1 thioesterase family protein [Phenylobacterium sp.]MDP2212270.1 thioesterase family protein [Phenylobacterium sp.]